MRRSLIFVLLLFVATTLLSLLQKPIFVLWNLEAAGDASALEMLSVLWHGLPLDMSVAGYVAAPSILLAVGAYLVPHRVWHRIEFAFLMVAAAVLAVTFAVNVALYKYWAFPLDSSIFQYLATPVEAMASVTLGEAVEYSVMALVYFAAVASIYGAIARLLLPVEYVTKRRPLLFLAVMIVVAGLDFLAIRGGVTTAVANLSKVYFSKNQFLNHAAVQPLFSILSSVGDTGSNSDYEFCDDATLQSRADAIFGGGGTVRQLLREGVEKPNVVLIIAESFGRSTTDAVVEGQRVAQHLHRRRSEGVWFENIIASSYRTDRGVLALLSGFPAQPKESLMKRVQKSSRLASIASALYGKGYATNFLHGGDSAFTDMASYLYATGFEQVSDLKYFSIDAPQSKWGYADDVMAREFIALCSSLEQSESPYFAVWQTLSSHEPFDVPYKVFEDKMLNSMAFADNCIEEVVSALEQSPEWDNTLLIITADHAYPYPYGTAASSVTRHRIPMLWLGGALKAPCEVETYGSQSDIAATLLTQLGCSTADFPLSRNILDENIEHFGYYTFNNGFGTIDDEGVLVYDCTADAPITSEGDDARRQQRGETILQLTYKIINAL